MVYGGHGFYECSVSHKTTGEVVTLSPVVLQETTVSRFFYDPCDTWLGSHRFFALS